MARMYEVTVEYTTKDGKKYRHVEQIRAVEYYTAIYRACSTVKWHWTKDSNGKYVNNGMPSSRINEMNVNAVMINRNC